MQSVSLNLLVARLLLLLSPVYPSRFVCAMPSSKISASSPTLFRSYSVRSNKSYNCRIWEAARATSAAPTFFKRIVIDDGVSKEAYIDGALGCNNPIKQVLKEALNVFGPNRQIACILSIGTGQKETVGLAQPNAFRKWIPIGIISVLKEIATTCNTAAEEVEELFKGVNSVYFRLNVDQGMQNISLQEWKKLEEVANSTNAYLKESFCDKDYRFRCGFPPEPERSCCHWSN